MKRSKWNVTLRVGGNEKKGLLGEVVVFEVVALDEGDAKMSAMWKASLAGYDETRVKIVGVEKSEK